MLLDETLNTKSEVSPWKMPMYFEFILVGGPAQTKGKENSDCTGEEQKVKVCEGRAGLSEKTPDDLRSREVGSETACHMQVRCADVYQQLRISENINDEWTPHDNVCCSLHYQKVYPNGVGIKQLAA